MPLYDLHHYHQGRLERTETLRAASIAAAETAALLRIRPGRTIAIHQGSQELSQIPRAPPPPAGPGRPP